MIANLLIELTSPMFDTAQAQAAQNHVDSQGGTVYTWKSIEEQNWLEQGFARSDAIALVVLPEGLPPTIRMPDDQPEQE